MFTAAFSDLSWESVDLNGQPTPVYPKAWMVEKYLQEYAERWIISRKGEDEQRIVLGTRVTSAARVMGKWRIATITSCSDGDVEKVQYFDYLVIATGYLSGPKPLDKDIVGVVQLTTEPT
jgi:cation diffusion facilitator CzcD-associated flavoprotein CzcO